MKYKGVLVLLILAFLVQQCAKQTAPTGGPKDETAPKLVRSNPSHKEVNFNGKEIQLTFDELVQLNNPKEQILITPFIGKKHEVTAKKNKVIIQLNSELLDTTTYTINFRESVQDLTEKNPAKIKLAFSTGSYIDSLTITGTITDILTDKKLNNYTVALAVISDTLNIFKHAAPWVTLSDKQGRFALENLKRGHYLLYTFDDKNKNLIVESKSEKYGFKSDMINLRGPVDSIALCVFKLDATPLKLVSARPTFAYYSIRLSKSIVEFELSSQDNKEKLYSTIEPDMATIKVYNTIPNIDSLQIHLKALDSTANKVDTLIYLKFQKKESTKDKFSGKIEVASVYESNATLSAILSFSKPVIHFLSDSLFIQIDSLKRIHFYKEDLSWSEDFTKLTVRKKIEFPKKTDKPIAEQPEDTRASTRRTEKASTNNILILRKGSAISVESDSTTEITSSLKIIKVEDNGIISTKVQTKENFILQLLDKSGKLIQESENTSPYTFENIQAGSYILRLLIDLNKNGKWDAGNYLTQKQPEPVIFWRNAKRGKDQILKANWHVGPLLITY